MMRALPLLALSGLLLFCASCGSEKPDPAIICHNSNCVEPPDPTRDDSPEALRESIKAGFEGSESILDGIEMDLFLRGTDSACIFAHDLNQENPVLAVDAAQIVGDFLASRPQGAKVTRTGGPFWVFLELKASVGKTKAEVHTPAQEAAHAACALAVLDILRTGATAAGVPLQVRFTSFAPNLLRAVHDALSNTNWTNSPSVNVGLGAIAGVLPPLDSGTRPISDFETFPNGVQIDMITIHAQWMRESAYQAYLSRHWDIGFWMFSAVPETYDAIELFEPKWITTNEARTFARWLARD